jgi:hypothetical protein
MKTIIEMAREADPKANLSEPYCLDHETRAWLERFAALVAAAEFAKREWNFCERCGKRTADLTTIHTCTTPPAPRPWVGLTGEEIDELAEWHGLDLMVYVPFTEAIEAKLKEKNTPQIDPNKWAFDNGLEST